VGTLGSWRPVDDGPTQKGFRSIGICRGKSKGSNFTLAKTKERRVHREKGPTSGSAPSNGQRGGKANESCKVLGISQPNGGDVTRSGRFVSLKRGGGKGHENT